MSREKKILIPAESVRQLPALNAFEAAARLGSFQEAATFLHLTPSAISHQVRRLEGVLGVALFVRRNRQIELTESGRKLQLHVSRGLAEISIGLQAVKQASDTSPLRISVAPSFAATYLSAGMAQFERENPDITVHMEFSSRVADLEARELDIAIRHTTQTRFNVFSEKLADVSGAPVCAPQIAARLVAGERIESIPRITLAQAPGVWTLWNQAAGRMDVPPQRELLFESLSDGLQAAIDGHGLMMAPLGLIEKHLKNGQLVLPFKEKLERVSAYRLLCLNGNEMSPKVLRLRRWLKAVIRNSGHFGDGLDVASHQVPREDR
ncbi:LysR family transcriptional regulator [Pseudomonas sp. PDM28]|uniref:LysR substrate-binding domain-containing protein n=1 Tax=Pseudomonas sp. PDM28 TaxID=2854770 RepID=UPI001C437E35|nr:LysR substrate-binding domain-containing protein [Pseudomonas sp. PDM28]MBV7554501.1 LysR family transcriptional regulator [Pseudomonas sp. PDM28]